MRLHRTLFYILFGVFVAGILMAVFVSHERVVLSRIATGLITGSFVGLISTLANYAFIWQQFITKTFDNGWALYRDLENELLKAKARIKYITTVDKQTLISQAHRQSMQELEREFAEEHRYDKYISLFDYSSYASLFFRRKTLKALDDLEREAYTLGMIASYASFENRFSWLQDGFADPEEEEMVIGNKDTFYDFIIQNIYDWRDYTAHCIRRLTASLTDLQHSIKPFRLGEDYREIPNLLHRMSERTLQGLPVRNPLEENVKEFFEDDNIKASKSKQNKNDSGKE